MPPGRAEPAGYLFQPLLDAPHAPHTIISTVLVVTVLGRLKGKLMQLGGCHYQMGLTAGRIVREQADPLGQSHPAAEGAGKQVVKQLGAHAPRLLGELTGMAEALGCARSAAGEMLAAAADRQVGCSAFWAGPDQTADGRPLFGRNWDYRPRAATTARLVATHPVRGYCHLSFTNHPIGRYGGTNEAGLTVATAVVPARETGEGLRFTLATRRILEICAGVQDACDFLESVPHRSAVNFLLADSEGRAARMEIEPGRLMKGRVSRFAAITNHFASVPEQLASPRLLKSRQRLSNLRSWFRANAGLLEADRAEKVLSDRDEGVCARGNPNVHFATVTLWSWIVRPGEHTVRAAMGSPHCTPYESHALPDAGQTATR